MQIDRIKYTMKHRKAFRAVEKQLLGHNTIRGYLHDLDKVFLYMIMDYKRAHKIHRSHSRHHTLKARLCTNGYRLGMCQTHKAGQADGCQRNTG